MTSNKTPRHKKCEISDGFILEEELKTALFDGFEAISSGRSSETKAQAWRHIKTFARFIQISQISLPFPDDILSSFKSYLTKTTYAPRYSAQIHQYCSRLLQWVSQNTKHIVKNLRVDASARMYQKKLEVLPSNLQADDIKSILLAAYSDIKEVEARFHETWQAIESGSHPLAGLIEIMLHENRTPPLREKTEIKIEHVLQLNKFGGPRLLRRLLFPSATDIFPYYIAILCQCSGNPMAIRLLERNCIVPHPLRSDRERIIWSKPRAGQEQRADFSVKPTYSAPNLVRRLINLNSSLAAAITVNKEKLFIAYGSAGITVPSWQAIHYLHQDFIKRHGLRPHFLKDFRKTGAELHAEAAGTLLRAKSRLNHKSVKTTRAYVSKEVLRELHDDRIAEHQSRLHEMLTRVPETRTCEPVPLSRGTAETVFGFTCKDPWSGIQKGEEGRRCLKFTGCATCPGAIVLLDNVDVIARLLSTVDQLEDARRRAVKEGWLDRYSSLYEATLKIINDELLPKVSQPIMARAKLVRRQKNVIYLE